MQTTLFIACRAKKLLFQKFPFNIWQIFNWKSRHACFPRRDCTHTKIFINAKREVSCTYSLDRLFNERPKAATTTKRDHSITEHFLGFFHIYCHLSFLDDSRMKQKKLQILTCHTSWNHVYLGRIWIENTVQLLLAVWVCSKVYRPKIRTKSKPRYILCVDIPTSGASNFTNSKWSWFKSYFPN